MTVYDISRTLAPGMAIWPGDQPFERDWTETIASGGGANVGRIRTSLHAGTHADAPFHFLSAGATMDRVSLEVFVGDAIVIDAGEAAVLGSELLNGVADLPPRVLFRTAQSRRADDAWDPTFPAVQPGFASVLADRGVVLIGTDSPSVDAFESTGMQAHHALGKHGIHILENLQLRDVEPGRYMLVAAPLKLAGMDGSPVRAILIAQ